MNLSVPPCNSGKYIQRYDQTQASKPLRKEEKIICPKNSKPHKIIFESLGKKCYLLSSAPKSAFLLSSYLFIMKSKPISQSYALPVKAMTSKTPLLSS